MPAEPLQAYDAVLVLGAALRRDGSPSPALRRRALHGASLVREGHAPVLLLSGGRRRPPRTEAEAMRALALAEGVPPGRIVLEDRSVSTLENAVFSHRILAREGWRRVLVVSDPYHLYRGVWLLRRLGLEAHGSPAPGGREANPAWRWAYYHLREAAALPWHAAQLYLMKRNGRM
ncbi:MAG: YdcF family protein [Candidatus Tectomicrobia bacterium]|uniref:YdcF family protein n=1 Tax=Tectimicrobiota bacterium TaxID=2528274 RepID=A0A932HZB4_UNCTE|nr:YdcF family protein [Candidatus Tectomicrobia bacterium]